MSDRTIPLQYASGVRREPGRYRWWICGLLFFATTISYIDRQVIAILKPELQHELGWNEINYGDVVFWFQAMYALGYLLAGRVMDGVGVRIGFALAVGLWSLAAMGHAMVRSVFGFQVARGALGLAEGGNFPGAVKTVAQWFPLRERAFATGLFNAGSNVGAMLTPIIVPWITIWFGWRAAFLVTGSLGFLWIIVWWLTYRSPEEVGSCQLEVGSGADDGLRVRPTTNSDSWLKLLRHRQVWAFVAGMFMTSPIWWFYLYWIPDFLNKRHGLDLIHMGPPLVVIYLMTDVGSIAGGWVSSRLIKLGWSVNAGRKTAMLLCALCVVPVFYASIVSSLWPAVLLVGLAASAHQGWSANLFTLVSDTVPQRAVSSVVGIGGMAASIGGMCIAKLAGYVLEWTHSYVPLFVIASSAYLAAFAIVHLINPRLTPMAVEEQA